MLGIVAAAFALAACAQDRPQPPPPDSYDSAPLASLPGWAEEDHLAALRAVEASCLATRDQAPSAPCQTAPALQYMGDDAARAFMEANFIATPITGEGRLTGYFMPIYEARRSRSDAFDSPVRPRPADLPPQDFSSAAKVPYADRAAIEARPADDALAWMRPEDLFFMQIQGSGVLTFEDGSHLKAVFAGANGAPFVGIAAPMRSQGLIIDQASSAEAIHDWLADHRGREAQAVMDLDPRYVFFSLGPDDGQDPFGAAGRRLVPGRSVAIDPAFHAMGELLWIDGEAPVIAGAMPAYRRLAVALDTGGAIKGEARADLYLGRGPAAGAEAGRIRHQLRLWRLVLRSH